MKALLSIWVPAAIAYFGLALAGAPQWGSLLGLFVGFTGGVGVWNQLVFAEQMAEQRRLLALVSTAVRANEESREPTAAREDW